MPRRLIKTAALVFPIALSLLWASSALALSIGVSPGKLHFDVSSGGSEKQILYVINQSDEESGIQVYIDGEQADWIRIIPASFTMDAHSTQSVEIIVEPPLTGPPENYTFSISVLSIPPNSELKIGAGVKVPVEINVSENPADDGRVAEAPTGPAESPENQASPDNGIPVYIMLIMAGVIAVLIISVLILWKKVRND